MHRKLIMLGVVLLLIPFLATATADSYHENVNVLILGRCATVYEFTGLHVGRLRYCGVTAFSPFPIKDKIHVFTGQGNYLGCGKTTVFMHNATGVFLWTYGGWGRVLPFSPMVLIMCRAERLWISEI